MAFKETEEQQNYAAFRFLDLPAELRNIIYTDLLTTSLRSYAYCRRTCHPEILATCRQLHAEASDVLHNNVNTSAWLSLSSRPELVSCEYTVRGLFNKETVFTANQGDLTTSVPWPSCLVKLRSITIELDLWTPGRPIERKNHQNGEIQMNHAVHDLSKLISSNSRLQELKIFVMGNVNKDRVDTIMSPISTLWVCAERVKYLRLSGEHWLAWRSHAIPDAGEQLKKIRSYGDDAMYKAALAPKHIPHWDLEDNAMDQESPEDTCLVTFASAQELQGMILSRENQGKVSRSGEETTGT